MMNAIANVILRLTLFYLSDGISAKIPLDLPNIPLAFAFALNLPEFLLYSSILDVVGAATENGTVSIFKS